VRHSSVPPSPWVNHSRCFVSASSKQRIHVVGQPMSSSLTSQSDRSDDGRLVVTSSNVCTAQPERFPSAVASSAHDGDAALLSPHPRGARAKVSSDGSRATSALSSAETGSARASCTTTTAATTAIRRMTPSCALGNAGATTFRVPRGPDLEAQRTLGAVTASMGRLA
jgi:hypothetical protein